MVSSPSLAGIGCDSDGDDEVDDEMEVCGVDVFPGFGEEREVWGLVVCVWGSLWPPRVVLVLLQDTTHYMLASAVSLRY